LIRCTRVLNWPSRAKKPPIYTNKNKLLLFNATSGIVSKFSSESKSESDGARKIIIGGTSAINKGSGYATVGRTDKLLNTAVGWTDKLINTSHIITIKRPSGGPNTVENR
jgi:hypothetical protein